MYICSLPFVPLWAVTADLDASIIDGSGVVVPIEQALCEWLQGGHTLLAIHGVHVGWALLILDVRCLLRGISTHAREVIL